ncbi:MAG TPA: VOC family protein [Patescibacteria group bacterium]|nr:VOC family protein [Patescibacteria group bacterium]
MLGDARVVPVLAVKDLEEAKKFYSETLGLKQLDERPDGVRYAAGAGSQLFVYPSQYAGTNQATAVGFHVQDVRAAVAELQGKGVKFEEYDMPDVKRDGAVHTWGDFNSAWFKDPAGNILAVDDMQE